MTSDRYGGQCIIIVFYYRQYVHAKQSIGQHHRDKKKKVVKASSDIKQKLIIQRRFPNRRDQRFYDVRLNWRSFGLRALRNHHLPCNASRALSRTYARRSTRPRNSRLRDLRRDHARFRSSRRRRANLRDRFRPSQRARGSSRRRDSSDSGDRNWPGVRSTTRGVASRSTCRPASSFLWLGRGRFRPGREGVVLG